jgi:drug/metabolite transporter (DMT)-like permease
MNGGARREVRGRLALVLTAVIFGSTFVVVSEGIRDLTPAAFIALRFSVGAVALVPLCRGAQTIPRSWAFWRPALLGGGLLATGYVTQTIGLEHISPSASGFITGLYVAATPGVAWLFGRHRPSPWALAGTVVSVVGLFVLTGGVDGLGRGEWLTIGCALAFAGHIVFIASYTHRLPLVPFTVSQLVVVALVGVVWLPFDGVGHVSGGAVAGAVYTGLVASALAFSLQIFGQRSVDPTRSALLLSMEPVFAGAFGYWAGDRLGGQGWTGAAVIVAGTLLAELVTTRAPSPPAASPSSPSSPSSPFSPSLSVFVSSPEDQP